MSLTLESVTHCWHYSCLLQYQLSSLAAHPPHTVDTTWTVFYAQEDARTAALLDCFLAKKVPNLTWNFIAMPDGQACRRAIGRNRIALESQADWVWMNDADYLLGPGGLDQLAETLQAVSTEYHLVFPQTVLTCSKQDGENLIVKALQGGIACLPFPDVTWGESTYRRAIGGAQIIRGDFARAHGYLKGWRRFQRGSAQWAGFSDDVAYRRHVAKTTGYPVMTKAIHRIRHHRPQPEQER